MTLKNLKTIMHALFKSTYALIENSKAHLHLSDIFALLCHNAKQYRFIVVSIGNTFPQDSHGLLYGRKSLFMSRHRILLLFKKHNTFVFKTTSPKTGRVWFIFLQGEPVWVGQPKAASMDEWPLDGGDHEGVWPLWQLES